MAGQSHPACEQRKQSLSYAEMVVAFVFFCCSSVERRHRTWSICVLLEVVRPQV